MLGFKDPSAVGAADHAFAGLLAQSVGNALARAKTFERERHDRRYAEMLSQAREEVLGIVAHDLRNPLGVAGAVLQVLAEPNLDESEREKLITSGTRAVHQMNRLIGDLLDVMRIESGRLALEMEDLRVAAVLTQAEESARHLAEEQADRAGRRAGRHVAARQRRIVGDWRRCSATCWATRSSSRPKAVACRSKPGATATK